MEEEDLYKRAAHDRQPGGRPGRKEGAPAVACADSLSMAHPAGAAALGSAARVAIARQVLGILWSRALVYDQEGVNCGRGNVSQNGHDTQDTREITHSLCTTSRRRRYAHPAQLVLVRVIERLHAGVLDRFREFDNRLERLGLGTDERAKVHACPVQEG